MSSNKSLINSLISEGYLKTPHIIGAFRAIDRADFTPPEEQDATYENYPLPIGSGQTISQPLTVAFMLELLNPQPGENILDIGSGSGWTTALLAYCVSQENTDIPASPKRERDERNIYHDTQENQNGKVFAIERIPKICKFGEENIKKYNFVGRGIVKTFCKDGTKGLPEHAPFDKILASAAAVRKIPDKWRAQLKTGGKIVAPVDNSIWLFTKTDKNKWEEKEFPGFVFVPLMKDANHPLRPRSEASESPKETSPDPTGQTQITNYEKKNQNKAKKENKFWKQLAIGGLFLIIGSGIVLVNETYRPHTFFNGTKQVEIMPGLGSRKIGALLKKEGIIRSKWTFVTYVSLRGKASYLKPGLYSFNEAAAIPEIARLLAGNAKKEKTITIIEGWNADDIESYFASQNIIRDENFKTLIQPKGLQTFAERFEFLKDMPKTAGLEGYLFPDTYRIYDGSPAEEIIEKMLGNFDKKLIPELRNEISRKGKTIFEIITIASLIEKEVVSDEDRAIVSGILWKRLKTGIPLQVDATIIYITTHDARKPEVGEFRHYGASTTHKKNEMVSIEDTKIDSPYNTYLYRGLPKGPIGNPGLSAIRAAIYPKESPYLYYLSTPEGKTIFSRTLEEHNIAKAKYLK